MEMEIHGNLPREAPGDSESTQKAFALISEVPEAPNILGVGCGPGASALVLAEVSGGHVTAVDVNQAFLDELEKRAVAQGLETQVTTSRQSMFEMNFLDETFDIVWAEGAIFVMGFEAGLKAWKKFLKANGYIVLTELSWLTLEPSLEPKAFWGEHYPGMRTVGENISTLKRCGYTLERHFTLPESSWWNEYYRPWEERLQGLKAKYAHNPEVLIRIGKCLDEIDLYRKFHKEYGYVFYIAKLES